MSNISKVSFNNKNSPFFDALRSKVDNYFKSNNIKQTGNYKLFIKTGILLSLITATYIVLVFFTPPVWISISLCCLFGLNLAAIGFNVMHDGAHGSFSSKRFVNEAMAYSLNLMGGNSFLWKAKHNLNHHSFTNIHGMDDDIDIEPWIRVHKEHKKYWFHRFQHIYWVILYGVTYLLWVYVKDFDKYFKGKVANTPIRKMSNTEHFVFWFSKAVNVALFIVLPIIFVGFWETVIGYSVIAFVTGFVIAIVFQLAHIMEDTKFPMPDDNTNKIEEEWAIHQVKTTANFSTRSRIISWYTGGLNFQVEHHLFPKVSHIHYPQISKFVRETCEQFNVRYIEYPTLLSAVRSHVMFLKQSGV